MKHHRETPRSPLGACAPLAERPVRVVSVMAGIGSRTGGPAINLMEAMPHMAGAGIDLQVFTTDNLGPASAEFSRVTSASDAPGSTDWSRIRLCAVDRPRRMLHSQALTRGLREVAGTTDVFRVHGLHLHPQQTAAAVARRTETPYLVTTHGALTPFIRGKGSLRKHLTGLMWQNRMLARAAALQFTTEEEAAEAVGVLPEGPTRLVMPNGVDVEQYRSLPPGSLARRKHLGGYEGPVILFLSRIAEKKRIDWLLQSFARVLRQVGDARLIIAGPDDEGRLPALETLAAELGVAGSVAFVGPRFDSERSELLSAADVWVLPSVAENFGNAVMEAMASRLPVVITPGVNIAPQVEAHDAGLVRRDIEGIARAVCELLDDPQRREVLGRNGASLADQYSWSNVVKHWNVVYRAIAAGTPAPSWPVR